MLDSNSSLLMDVLLGKSTEGYISVDVTTEDKVYTTTSAGDVLSTSLAVDSVTDVNSLTQWLIVTGSVFAVVFVVWVVYINIFSRHELLGLWKSVVGTLYTSDDREPPRAPSSGSSEPGHARKPGFPHMFGQV